MNDTPFSTLKLNPALLDNVLSLGYEAMTPIQALSLPPILAGKDVIAQGKTGSGKTAAFSLGLLQGLHIRRFCIQALVLCPTRELADQVANEIRKLGRTLNNLKVLTLCGGTPFGPQVGSLEHGNHVVVGTPGRIADHLRRETLDLSNLQILVLDEADRMLDMGFQAEIEAIIEQTPTQRQTLLFSATFPEQIDTIAQRIMNDPVTVQAISTHDNSTIQQHFYQVEDSDRLTALRLLLLEFRPASAVVFCNTKVNTAAVADELRGHGFSVLALHGDLEQRDRDQTLARFANKSASILVATDVAARGLDIDTLDAVINYDIARDAETHVHRIGRTGRAGSNGIACTLYSEKERGKIARIELYLDQTMESLPLPPLTLLDHPPYTPPMTTLQIDGGKKQKVRPGDILGALTGEAGITGQQVGKIQVFENFALVAVNRDATRAALQKLTDGKLKGRSFRVREIRG